MQQAQPDGYLAISPSAKGRAVLVLHAWWGLNDTIKAICNRLAEAGFIAFAPDLYHGKIATTIADAETYGRALDNAYEQAQADIVEAVNFLNQKAATEGRGIALVAFSLGAFYALELANAAPEAIRAVVLFYGTGGDNFANSQASYLGHYAENDPYEHPAAVDALEQGLKQAGRPVTFFRYPGTGHWFFEPDRTDAYDAAAAELAWERTLAFLKATIPA